MDRPTPFELVFADLAERFPALRDDLAKAGTDPRNRDAFLLTLPAMQLLRDLRPDDEGAGAGVPELAALLHHAYLAWAGGLHTWTLDADSARRALAAAPPAMATPEAAGYLQLPERLVWASLGGAAWEPLDGCFVDAAEGGDWRVLGVFGLHPSREGFTVAEAAGQPGARATRADGAPLFSPALEGGERAGLYAVVEPGELVELAARGVGAAR